MEWRMEIYVGRRHDFPEKTIDETFGNFCI